MRRPPRRHRDLANDGAAIAAGADPERQGAGIVEACLEAAAKGGRLRLVGHEDEARRSPRALASPAEAVAPQPIEHGGNARARIAAALHRGEMVADPRVDFAD